MKLKASLAVLVLLTLALALGGIAWVWHYAHTPLKLESLPKDFSVQSGSSLQAAAQQMTEAQVLTDPWNFIILARALDKSAQIKAGQYRIEEPLTPLQLLDKITRGEVSHSAITLLEGWTFRQLRVALSRNPELKQESEK